MLVSVIGLILGTRKPVRRGNISKSGFWLVISGLALMMFDVAIWVARLFGDPDWSYSSLVICVVTLGCPAFYISVNSRRAETYADLKNLLGIIGMLVCLALISLGAFYTKESQYPYILPGTRQLWQIVVIFSSALVILSLLWPLGRFRYKGWKILDNERVRRYIGEFEEKTGKAISRVKIITKPGSYVPPKITGSIFHTVIILPESPDFCVLKREGYTESEKEALYKFTVFHELAHYINRNVPFLLLNLFILLIWIFGLLVFLYVFVFQYGKFMNEVFAISKERKEILDYPYFFLELVFFVWLVSGFVWTISISGVSKERELQADLTAINLMSAKERKTLLMKEGDNDSLFKRYVRLSGEFQAMLRCVYGFSAVNIIKPRNPLSAILDFILQHPSEKQRDDSLLTNDPYSGMSFRSTKSLALLGGMYVGLNPIVFLILRSLFYELTGRHIDVMALYLYSTLFFSLIISLVIAYNGHFLTCKLTDWKNRLYKVASGLIYHGMYILLGSLTVTFFTSVVMFLKFGRIYNQISRDIVVNYTKNIFLNVNLISVCIIISLSILINFLIIFIDKDKKKQELYKSKE